MKVQLSYAQIREINQGIESCKPLQGIKFTYCISKNQRILDKEIKLLEETEKTLDEYNKYRGRIRTIHNENVVKGEEGKEETVVDESGNKIPRYKDQVKVESILKELRKKFSKTIEEQEKKKRAFQKFLLEKVEVDINEFRGDLPTGHKLSLKQDLETGEIIEKIDPAGNNINLYQVDGIIYLLVMPDVIPKTGQQGTIMVGFTRQAILDYKEFFQSLYLINNPEFIEIFKKNIFILKTMQQELWENKLIRDYFDIFEEARMELIREHSIKNIYGDPIAVQSGNQLKFVLKDDSKFTKDLDQLKEKHKDIIDAHKAFVDELVEIPMYSIPEDILWEEIDGNQMEALIDFIS